MRLAVVVLFAVLLACQPRSKSAMEVENLFDSGVALGAVDKKLEEASGLVGSVTNKGMLWTHNDSGNPADLFLIDDEGEIKMTCRLQDGDNRDWEDIALGTGEDGKTYVYIGDIGDNMRRYKTK